MATTPYSSAKDKIFTLPFHNIPAPPPELKVIQSPQNEMEPMILLQRKQEAESTVKAAEGQQDAPETNKAAEMKLKNITMHDPIDLQHDILGTDKATQMIPESSTLHDPINDVVPAHDEDSMVETRVQVPQKEVQAKISEEAVGEDLIATTRHDSSEEVADSGVAKVSPVKERKSERNVEEKTSTHKDSQGVTKISYAQKANISLDISNSDRELKADTNSTKEEMQTSSSALPLSEGATTPEMTTGGSSVVVTGRNPFTPSTNIIPVSDTTMMSYEECCNMAGHDITEAPTEEKPIFLEQGIPHTAARNIAPILSYTIAVKNNPTMVKDERAYLPEVLYQHSWFLTAPLNNEKDWEDYCGGINSALGVHSIGRFGVDIAPDHFVGHLPRGRIVEPKPTLSKYQSSGFQTLCPNDKIEGIKLAKAKSSMMVGARRSDAKNSGLVLRVQSDDNKIVHSMQFPPDLRGINKLPFIGANRSPAAPGYAPISADRGCDVILPNIILDNPDIVSRVAPRPLASSQPVACTGEGDPAEPSLYLLDKKRKRQQSLSLSSSPPAPTFINHTHTKPPTRTPESEGSRNNLPFQATPESKPTHDSPGGPPVVREKKPRADFSALKGIISGNGRSLVGKVTVRATNTEQVEAQK
ncbi:uncharacterized protein BDR25DRAFT_313001 [Lindgomyces ingoldianus]|uniref:Uncharacterized protein n=1 Tax=Lindgomyces ingoldianus TaxID=673940 RepID=A0ACB6R0Y3_9PLEO|nr:uncharacterized protein BDR25DRAFT_313001 [Lindgomyces ingoldianus]KAF2472478.1 hypothetical protein BDR25DRAFT_313001 [Lindgomyces ingoldianus]